MVVMLVWRIMSWRSSSAAMILINCPGLLLDKILIIASNPRSFTSTSAKRDLLSAVSSRSPPPLSISTSCFIWSFTGKGGEKNGGCCCVAGAAARAAEFSTCLDCASPRSLLLFCDSKHWRSCSNSLTNSIAPPIIEAWSPFIDTSKKKIKRETKNQEGVTKFVELK